MPRSRFPDRGAPAANLPRARSTNPGPRRAGLSDEIHEEGTPTSDQGVCEDDPSKSFDADHTAPRPGPGARDGVIRTRPAVGYDPHVVTSVDLAAYLGLSQSTVSRVMRGDPAVAERTTKRVLAAARELGYVPNSAARSLVTRRARAIGVVVADLTSPFYPTVVDAIQHRLSERGYRMALIRDPDVPEGVDSVDVLDPATVDGMIFVSARRKSRTVRRVLERNTPVVLLSRDDPTLSLEVVLSDDEGAGELVIEHLTALGHRDIAILSVPRDRTNGAAREDGARQALQRRGIALPDHYIRRATMTHEHGVDMATSLLSMDHPPSAIYCVTDELAFAALDAAARLGVSVPGELSVIGFDDSPQARWAMINLTTIHQPIEDMAAEAVQLLLARLDDNTPEQPGKRVFPVSLQIRGTTGPAPQRAASTG
ncbi:LacI family DNA-binding transcriptional regulator [Rhodococcus opacus]|nr:LacI family DNA-binding transcriptional regulator [Rhodococcus opacus]